MLQMSRISSVFGLVAKLSQSSWQDLLDLGELLLDEIVDLWNEDPKVNIICS